MTFKWQKPIYDLDDYINEWPEFAGRPTYQFYAFSACFPHIKNFRTAIDAGANIGVWSYAMSRCFAKVHAFEPLEAIANCWRSNMSGIPGAELHQTALGDSIGSAQMKPKTVALKTRIDPNGSDTVKMDQIDRYGIKKVDFIKIDCEGYETAVIRGATNTIRRDLPLILVEQKPGAISRYGFPHATDVLADWGYKVLWEKRGDYCLSAQ